MENRDSATAQRGDLIERLNSIGDPLQSLVAGKTKLIGANNLQSVATAKDVAAKVPDALSQLEACRQTWLWSRGASVAPALRSERRDDLLKALWKHYQQHEPASWDECVQYYLALVAIDRSAAAAAPKNAAAKTGGPAAGVLNQIRNKLSFPDAARQSIGVSGQAIESAGTSSLLRVLKPGYNSPADFNPQSAGLPQLFRQAFQQLSTMSAPL
jgi:hypothetical protein